MSEASRIRYLWLKNRLEELLARYGPPEEWVDQGADLEPTWGPVGSLAAKLMTDLELGHLLAMDRDLRSMRPGSSSGPRGPGW